MNVEVMVLMKDSVTAKVIYFNIFMLIGMVMDMVIVILYTHFVQMIQKAGYQIFAGIVIMGILM